MGMFFLDEVGSSETIPLESFELSEDELSMYLYGDATVDFLRNPTDANNYTVEWTSSDESIVTVTGNRRRANISANGEIGTAVITCTVYVDDEVFGTASLTVTVDADPELNAAANVAGGSLVFGTTNPYPFTPVQGEDRYYLTSTNQGVSNSASELITNVTMQAGETIEFDYFVSSEADYDFFRFYVTASASSNSRTSWKIGITMYSPLPKMASTPSCGASRRTPLLKMVWIVLTSTTSPTPTAS